MSSLRKGWGFGGDGGWGRQKGEGGETRHFIVLMVDRGKKRNRIQAAAFKG